MERVVKHFDRKHGFGFAVINFNEDKKTYQGVCSTGESTAHYDDLFACISALCRLGYVPLHY